MHESVSLYQWICPYVSLSMTMVLSMSVYVCVRVCGFVHRCVSLSMPVGLSVYVPPPRFSPSA